MKIFTKISEEEKLNKPTIDFETRRNFLQNPQRDDTSPIIPRQNSPQNQGTINNCPFEELKKLIKENKTESSNITQDEKVQIQVQNDDVQVQTNDIQVKDKKIRNAEAKNSGQGTFGDLDRPEPLPKALESPLQPGREG